MVASVELILELTIDQYKEICAQPCQTIQFLRDGDKLNGYDYNSSTGEQGPDSKAVSRSSEEVISFDIGINFTYWETMVRRGV